MASFKFNLKNKRVSLDNTILSLCILFCIYELRWWVGLLTNAFEISNRFLESNSFNAVIDYSLLGLYWNHNFSLEANFGFSKVIMGTMFGFMNMKEITALFHIQWQIYLQVELVNEKKQSFGVNPHMKEAQRKLRTLYLYIRL